MHFSNTCDDFKAIQYLLSNDWMICKLTKIQLWKGDPLMHKSILKVHCQTNLKMFWIDALLGLIGRLSERDYMYNITRLLSCVHESWNRFKNQASWCQNPNASNRIWRHKEWTRHQWSNVMYALQAYEPWTIVLHHSKIFTSTWW